MALALAVNSEMYAPFWGKPYGHQSEAREQKALHGSISEHLRFLERSKSAGDFPLTSTSRRRFETPLEVESKKAHCRQAVVKIKAYAHDRVVLMSYLKAPEIRGRSMTAKDLRSEVFGTNTLVKPHELRRHFEIGNRLRFAPKASRFTSYARNMVRDAAHIVERYGSGKGVFVTLTFPGGTSDGYRVLAAGSDYILDRLNRWLRYKIQDGLFVYVWELQKRGAGHLHYLFRLPEGTTSRSFSVALRTQWRKILLDVSASSHVDLFRRLEGGTWKEDPTKPRVQVKAVKRTYVQYMAKYISKSRSKDGAHSAWCPRRWWGCSQEARRLVRQNRLDAVCPMRSVDSGLSAILSVVPILPATTDGVAWFPMFPGSPDKIVSISFSPGRGLEIAHALKAYFEDGDLQPLSIALIEAGEHFRQRKKGVA